MGMGPVLFKKKSVRIPILRRGFQRDKGRRIVRKYTFLRAVRFSIKRSPIFLYEYISYRSHDNSSSKLNGIILQLTVNASEIVFIFFISSGQIQNRNLSGSVAGFQILEYSDHAG